MWLAIVPLVSTFSENIHIMTSGQAFSPGADGKQSTHKRASAHTHTNTCVQTKSQGSSARGVCQKAPEIISHSKQNPGTADRPWACTPEHSRQTAGTSLVAGAVGSGVRALGLKPTQTRLKLMSPSLDKPEPDWGCCCSHRAKCRGDYKGMYQRWGWTVDAEEWQEQISPKL